MTCVLFIICVQSALHGRYLFCCSYYHKVAPKGKFIAFVSTEAETNDPQSELKPGIDLLGPVDEILFEIYDRYEPVNKPALDNCFISTVSSISDDLIANDLLMFIVINHFFPSVLRFPFMSFNFQDTAT